MINLTPQEQRVIQFAAHGQTNAQIAQAMGLSPSTVKHYLRSACQKLRAANRTAAVARYYEHVGLSS
ncbi:MAG: DNA-binding response regulator [Candidatus Viridilinea halotolerans]|uniref:DNA-binding response regulator n=1 Tax=Candidatus Viridilinea halotolerans TaxID=2491704 RepID=A0A426UCH2_9CHLR|nr:MAG: DNA-binding response regulator [Candidatus Viridilinea halotolerans]